MQRISVFCGSYIGNDPRFARKARLLGAYLAEKKIELVYGGTHIGLMGVLADSVLEQGGSVEGIIPDLLEEMKIAHKGLTRLVKVPDMDTRKKLLIENSDTLLAFPGGYGTMDELFTALVRKQLGEIDKPIFLFNAYGFYDPLLAQLERMSALGFLKEGYREYLQVLSDDDELEDYLV
ncbi:MAG: TIGR00730 family Rossman fold protein [Bacteroidales bacterium]|nr:TIGR00730 family Rossman fold protein [Bacteroidales bacterium]